MERVLITGVNGFLGTHIARALLRSGFQVLGISIEADCNISHEDLSYRQIDIADGTELERTFTDHSIGSIIHLAALVHVRNRNLTFADYNKVNYRASEFLFNIARKYSVRSIVFASTIEVYGTTPRGCAISEDFPCRPESDYARTKLLAEEALISSAANSVFNYSILRFAPVYSATFRLNIDKRIYLRRPSLAYYLSRGNYQLSLCSIHNIEKFVLQWLSAASPPSGIFNLADDQVYSIKRVLKFEQRQGRCKVVLPLPYLPCMLTAAVWEAIQLTIGHQPGLIATHNIKKLMNSTVWDNARARAFVESFPWILENTLEAAN